MEDLFYTKIKDKIIKGEFVAGKNCKLTGEYYSYGRIEHVPYNKRTPSVCAELLNNHKCKFSDIPRSSITREFLIECFTDNEVYQYIKNNINSFDRQFFKDLIATNRHALFSDNNCFAIMPLDYIDEEMCSLAIIRATDSIDSRWFYIVVDRKSKALTADLWALGARLYTWVYDDGKDNKFLNMTPEQYRTREYYKEMCRSSYSGKNKIVASFPKEIVTPLFLQELLFENIEVISLFNEEALEQEITYTLNNEQVTEKIWQYAIKNSAKTIEMMKLNDERVKFFLKYYPKNSFEYNLYFMKIYHKYLKKKQNPQQYEENQARMSQKARDLMTVASLIGIDTAMRGGDTQTVVNEMNKVVAKVTKGKLPIYYKGSVPDELIEIYDKIEYLKAVYEAMGIEIVGEYDRLSYEVIIPEDVSIKSNGGYYYMVSNEDKSYSLIYFDYPSTYDRDFDVREINLSQEALEEIINQSQKNENYSLIKK